MADELEKVWVQPAVKGRVGLWARGPEYEGGELFIAWGHGECPPPVEVPLTSDVKQALAHRMIVHANVPRKTQVKAKAEVKTKAETKPKAGEE